jgi:hypothetical protein
VIATNRAAKGYPLTLSYEALWEMAVKLPDRIACFGAFRGSEMVAASVCVKVRPDILYVFYWGELPTMKRISPTTFLAARMLDFAKQTGLEIMDLGISTEHSEPNLGLMKYKSHLGSFPSLKLVLEKTL